ncbi:MAG: vacuolar membrane-associated protein iml1 [Ramalina farinacea]|uniref:Vacuolar membrane-associated protein IML1 n=1 Tax=Ramalina farinacea TaxID=258253 RepID=A0AA43QGP8_9LECA|nr:vacuolar membrane-associated protein iml1 [Ramalina farinacea]
MSGHRQDVTRTSAGPRTPRDGDPEDHREFSLLASAARGQYYTLSIHDNATSPDVLLNPSMFPSALAQPGSLMKITSESPGSSQLTFDASHGQPSLKPSKSVTDTSYLFFAKFAPPEMISKLPSLQISLPNSVATGLRLSKNSTVLVSTEDESTKRASHVEIIFRDQYLARADMWRLITSQLMGKCIYRGQKIEFMGTIKALVKNVFIRDDNLEKDDKIPKVSSALFHHSTKPVFRSESARYVLFIQMSKEMWEFDAEGTGEIMFDKVVNGFLPELFRRWKQTQVRHLVSIVLFTRMEYEKTPRSKSSHHEREHGASTSNQDTNTKDYYRVVVSDMASIESAAIMDRLKREFQVFLRDVSLTKPTPDNYAPLGSGLSAASAAMPDEIIAGLPCAASQGNVLEAINLATSQFSSDYVDRDLVRTGVSIILISPGTGVFEVDYNLLLTTTENLTDNGVGIDLVCLSRLPLHSVPLFKFMPRTEQMVAKMEAGSLDSNSTPTASFSNTMNFGTPVTRLSPSSTVQNGFHPHNGWSYGIPHWIDVSFWTGTGSDSSKARRAREGRLKARGQGDIPKHKPFRSRIRMYELQMMGITENAVSDISIPFLAQRARKGSGVLKGQLSHRRGLLNTLNSQDSPFGSPGSAGGQSGAQTPRPYTSSSTLPADDRSRKPMSAKWMDGHDENVFRHPLHPRKPNAEHIRKRASDKVAKFRKSSTTSSKSLLEPSQEADDESFPFRHPVTLAKRSTTASRSRANSNLSQPALPQDSVKKPKTTPRSISFGLRGLGVGAPKAAAAIASQEVAVGRDAKPRNRPQEVNPSENSSTRLMTAATADQNSLSEASKRPVSRVLESSQEESMSDSSEQATSRPIPIRNSTTMQATKPTEKTKPTQNPASGPRDRVATLTDLRSRTQVSDNEAEQTYGPNLPTLSPPTVLAPWLTVLNPCNPSQTQVASSDLLGWWYHIYPRRLKASQMKWKGLTSPAAVPLTIEAFPTSDQLAEEFRERVYSMTLPEEMDLSDSPRSLANELLAFRLSRGFQIVVGERVARTMADASLETLDVFSEKILTRTGSRILLSRGNTIHCLTRSAQDRIEIKILYRHSTTSVTGIQNDAQFHYTPLIRSMLSDSYEHQSISTGPQRGNFNWDFIDSFIAGYERPQAEKYVEALRPWRARFVLIPVVAPAQSHRVSGSKDLTAEEDRLEGIKKLTQLWQKCRYLSAEDRRFTRASRINEDANPLDVQYYTKNASAVVIEELNNAIDHDAASAPVQLLPEADLLQRPGLSTKTLAERIQGPKGVQIVDRRWHLKLHHNCLIGSELTTWLVENFRDVDTREEAVELGNGLLADGLFKHVEKRHDFRDGHYFYQISEEYSAPRQESKGFFGWGKASVPATPMKEAAPTELADTPSSTSSEVSGLQDSEGDRAETKKAKPSVALGKSLIYNLTHNRPKTSYREELINLHYDRLHNPDNCYHIRLEWMNATPKLIQDAVSYWAVIGEGYGLRLVEVPIGEASSVSSMHPFRAPYLIQLAKEPPREQPANFLDQKNTLPQMKTTEKHYYQKALLKQFSFVLDSEAASDFPPDVDVSYSWGRPGYRYPQYIHRSGLLLAQITNEGHFLLLANRMYNNKSSSVRIKAFGERADLHTDRSPINRRPNPLRAGDGLTRRFSPRESPFASPSLRATLDIPSTSGSTSRRPLSNISSSRQTAHNSISSQETISESEKLTNDFAEFCNNVEGLDHFYLTQMSRTSTPGPTTPFMSSMKTPVKAGGVSLEEGNIPELTLPSKLGDREPLSNNGVDPIPWNSQPFAIDPGFKSQKEATGSSGEGDAEGEGKGDAEGGNEG